MFIKLTADDDPEVKCKSKCTDQVPGEKPQPEKTLPEDPEVPEEEPKVIPFPDQAWWLDYDQNSKSAESVITFEGGSKFILEGVLAEQWGATEGQAIYDNVNEKLKIGFATTNENNETENHELIFKNKSKELFEMDENPMCEGGNCPPMKMQKMSRKAEKI